VAIATLPSGEIGRRPLVVTRSAGNRDTTGPMAHGKILGFKT
jgi:hypothetical protein